MNPDQREFGPRWNHAQQQFEYGWFHRLPSNPLALPERINNALRG